MTCSKHTAAALLALACSAPVVSAQAVFDWRDVNGTINLGGDGGALFTTQLSAELLPSFEVSPFAEGEASASAVVDETGAGGGFAATAPDGFASIDYAHTFSPSQDATVVVEWDFLDLTPTQAAAAVGLFDLTNGVVLLDVGLGLEPVASSASFEVLAGAEYVWSFSGTVTRRNAGSASASLSFESPACVADVTTEGVTNAQPDGLVSLSDFSFYLGLWAVGDAEADVTGEGSCDPASSGDGVTLSDFASYLSLWSQGCP